MVKYHVHVSYVTCFIHNLVRCNPTKLHLWQDCQTTEAMIQLWSLEFRLDSCHRSRVREKWVNASEFLLTGCMLCRCQNLLPVQGLSLSLSRKNIRPDPPHLTAVSPWNGWFYPSFLLDLFCSFILKIFWHLIVSGSLSLPPFFVFF